MKKRLCVLIAAFLMILSGCTNSWMEKVLRPEQEKAPEGPHVPVYTVRFDSNGGSAVPSQIVEKGKAAAHPPNPVKSGYGFVNWYNNRDLAEPPYDFSTPVTRDITLYAKWGTPHTVTFNSDGGSAVADQKVGDGGTLFRPEDPVKDLDPGLYLDIESTRRVFEGWYREAALVNLWNFSADTVRSDITLYARWSGPIPINISGAAGNNSVEKAVSHVNANANAGAYTLLAGADIDCAPQKLDAPNARLAIKGLGGEREIRLNATGALFTVGGGTNTGISLTLGENITLVGLSGNSQNTSALVEVNTGANFTMLPGSRISENTNVVTNGGGVYVNYGTFDMSGGEISGNIADNSGGGVYVNYGTFTMSGGEISGNTTTDGGGVYMVGGTFTMSGGTINDNIAANGGGGVFAYNGTVTMNGGKIYGNSGGGVFIDSGDFKMSGNSIISHNTAGSGGGVFINGTFTMNGGTINDNIADSDGGGVFLVSGGIFTMSGNSTIIGNSSTYSGGGVYAGFADFKMSGGIISGNSSTYSGGGVYVEGTFTMSGGVIYGKDVPLKANTAVAAAAVFVDGSGGTAQYSGGYGTGGPITTTDLTLPPGAP